MFLYQIINNFIRILGCRGYDGSIRIPKSIENMPVKELAAYSFSDSQGRKEMLASVGENVHVCDEEGKAVLLKEDQLPPEICGEKLKELYLPKTITKIGNYAFYNCYELTHVDCYSSISDLGSGLFTGCHKVRLLDMHIVDGQRSCMKDILSELKQELYVNYDSSQGNTKLVFPEMYEEAVEFTPAKVFSREMHGCGHRYRYCFDQTDFQFHKYDDLFPHIKVQEPESVVATLVFGRLSMPLRLLEKNREIYEAYLLEHFPAFVKLTLEEEDENKILWLSRQYAKSREDFDIMVEMANKESKSEVVSLLMEERRQRFPAKKRKFSL